MLGASFIALMAPAMVAIRALLATRDVSLPGPARSSYPTAASDPRGGQLKGSGDCKQEAIRREGVSESVEKLDPRKSLLVIISCKIWLKLSTGYHLRQDATSFFKLGRVC
jgi:hypothetical protein